MVSSSGSRDSGSCCAAKNAADLKDENKFISLVHSSGFTIGPGGNSWIYFHFKEMTIILTHYSIRSDFNVRSRSRQSEVVESRSLHGRKKMDQDRCKVANSELDDMNIMRAFPVARVELGHIIRRLNVGVNHSGDDQFVIPSFEIFGILIQSDPDRFLCSFAKRMSLTYD
jgi:hypothetical protein